MTDRAGPPEPRGDPFFTVAPPRDGRSEVHGIDLFELRTESIGDALLALAADAPDEPALMWTTAQGPGHITWSQLADRAQQAAAFLQEANPDRGRVALTGVNSVDWIVAMFACALSGMPVVPIGVMATEDEARYQISHARVRIIVADEPNGAMTRMTAAAKGLRPSPAVFDIGRLEATAPGAPATVSADDEFLLQFTSGTTGRPKAAILSHRSVLNTATAWARACGARPGDCYFNPLPLHHVGGLVTGVISVLAYGGAYTVVERFNSEAAVETIRQVKPAFAGLVPTMMIDMLALPGVTPDAFASLRTVAGGATAVDPGLIAEMEQRLGVTLMVGYGQSEAPAMTASSPDDTPRVRTQTLGRCVPGRDLSIRTEAGTVAPTGTPGELWVRGPLGMSGYLRADGTLDAAVDEDGWRRTGDVCSMDDEGVLVFHGRLREVIIRGGLNVYPAEVEHALSGPESVGEIAVFGVPDPRLGERVAAAVIPGSGAKVDVAELSELAARKLSAYKRPSEWFVVSTFPRTSAGKVRRHLLQQWHAEGVLEIECDAVRLDNPSTTQK